MLIIGCDFHTRYQQIAMANDETGELLLERRLEHASGEANAFYRNLQAPVRVGLRTMLGNQLHALAMSQGLCRKKKLFTKKGRMELAHLTLAPWASRRREEILRLLDQLEVPIEELDRAVLEEAKHRKD